MIEELLKDYGVLGLWTGTLLLDRYGFQKKIMKIVENNTKALEKVLGSMKRK